MISPESFNNQRPVLALSCCESLLQVVIGSKQGVLFGQEFSCPGNAMPHMAPAMAAGLRNLGLKPADLSGVACVRGPGSFTGIRMALATISGIAMGADLPMAGLELLPLIAARILPLHAGEVWVMTYARRNQVYLQGFRGPAGTTLTPARALTTEEAARTLADRPGPLVIVGSGVRLHQPLLEQMVPQGTLFPDPAWESPSLADISAAALAADFTRNPLRPIYLRQSDAEQNLESIARKRGIDVVEARKAIPDFESPEPNETR